MDINKSYPKISKRLFVVQKIRRLLAYIFLISSLICVFLNLVSGGQAWSIIVICAEWLFWTNILSRPLIENNVHGRISQLVWSACILLVLIDLFFSTESFLGWAPFVILIIYFSLMILLSIIFFSSFSKQKRNLMPLFWLIAGSLIINIFSFSGLIAIKWPTIALGSMSIVFLAVGIVWLRKPLIYELKKRFHTI